LELLFNLLLPCKMSWFWIFYFICLFYLYLLLFYCCILSTKNYSHFISACLPAQKYKSFWIFVHIFLNEISHNFLNYSDYYYLHFKTLLFILIFIANINYFESIFLLQIILILLRLFLLIIIIQINFIIIIAINYSLFNPGVDI
jgi:hypothetical protein